MIPDRSHKSSYLPALFIVLLISICSNGFSQNGKPKPSVILCVLDSVKPYIDSSYKLLCIDGIDYDKGIDSFARSKNMCVSFNKSGPWPGAIGLKTSTKCVYIEVDPFTIRALFRNAYFNNSGNFMGFSSSVISYQSWSYDAEKDTLQKDESPFPPKLQRN